jgi:magnesium-dependent phosphatase 1
MFELDSAPTEFDVSKGGVRAGGDVVQLFPGAQAVMRRLLTDMSFAEVKVAVASSTTEPRYAARCLEVLPADHSGERGERLADLVDFRQVYPGNKGRQHFPALLKETGIAYDNMIFFDDCTYGDNCGTVASACPGTTCVRTPKGLTEALFDTGLAAWADGKRGVV